MRAFVYLLVAIAVVAAAAFGVRHYGIDVAALTGLSGPVKTQAAGGEAAKGQGGARANRGPAAVETAQASVVDMLRKLEESGDIILDEDDAEGGA